ncbi:MAG: prolyl aminopeptidase [Pseudomonadota bacterium]
MTTLKALYPAISPYATGRLKVSDIHDIYYEEVGNPNGKPVVALHGGPGGGVTPSMRQYFDPQLYRIILFDQRGCGKSTPYASLEENNTWALVEDIEKLRQHLGIEKWQVFGGSWGSTLALIYAQSYPRRVSELVVRGIFMLRQSELDWFYQGKGANWIYPDAWEAFLEPIPEAERDDLIKAYYQRLTSDNEGARIKAARAWSLWEGRTLSLRPCQQRIDTFGSDAFAVAFARIECHYFINHGFFSSDDQILLNIEKIRDIPGVIVQGRYDVVTPMRSAWELSKAWPKADFKVVQDAGHASNETGIVDALVRATDGFAKNV